MASSTLTERGRGTYEQRNYPLIHRVKGIIMELELAEQALSHPIAEFLAAYGVWG
ncbi:hypothetical protein HMPREF9413_5968 [Paenibacillus sp. HGF7]|nr:hypothetical protein HMPREF9413_5968 [Paenibacillus sp. HGF7]